MPKTPKRRQCVRCGESFPLTTEFFYVDKARPDGFRHSCKPCWAEQNEDRGWGSTPREKRNRKPLTVTLPDETREKLELMAHRTHSSRSEIVEILINEARLPGEMEDE